MDVQIVMHQFRFTQQVALAAARPLGFEFYCFLEALGTVFLVLLP